MKVNELRKGYGAYELSWAEIGKSGPSFGGNQMDISVNAKGREILLDIVNYAKINGQDIFTKDEKNDIKTKLDKPEEMSSKRAEKVFGKNAEKINTALSSEYGINKINSVYTEQVKEKAKHIEEIVNNIKHPGAKEFYNSDYGKTLLFDYHNQYHLDKDGPLNKYINGESITRANQELSLKSDSYSFKDHLAYMLGTTYAVNNAINVKTRLENIKNYFEDLNPKTTDTYFDDLRLQTYNSKLIDMRYSY